MAANAARLGRLPSFFIDDRIGIAVIWGIAAVLIPIIREVVVVEAYYAFGFVSAFVITSTTVFFVRNDALQERGIDPDSGEAKSLRFAGLRGMIASYIMAVVLITQKTDALVVIIVAGAAITIFQLYIANGGLKRNKKPIAAPLFPPGTRKAVYDMGVERAHDQARQRGVVAAVEQLIETGALTKFNVDTIRIYKLVCYLYNVNHDLFNHHHAHQHGHQHSHHEEHDTRIEEPNLALEETYQAAYQQRVAIARRIEDYSHYGIFMFIHNYHLNWVSPEHGRDVCIVQQAMLDILFPQTPHDEIWAEYQAFATQRLPEPIWQFSRQRYLWAKDQWPNLSGRITTIWTLQDFGLILRELDIKTVISVADGKQYKLVKIHMGAEGKDVSTEKETVETLEEALNEVGETKDPEETKKTGDKAH